MSAQIDTLLRQLIQRLQRVEKTVGILNTLEGSSGGDVGGSVNGATTDDTVSDTDTFPYTTGSTLKKTAWLNIKSLLTTVFNAVYAPIAKGVTNGDSHDHSGGDGAQIDHTTLSNIGTNTHAQIDTHIASTSNPHSVTKSQVGLGNVDNTSDVTKNSAVAALTNKDLTSGTNTFPTFNQSTTGNAATATKLTTARNIDGQAFDGTANITVVAPAIHAATSQTPVDADEFGFWDSVGNILKKASLASLKSTFKTYFDTLYNLYVHPNHTGDVTSVGDGATTIAANAVTNAKAAQMATATIKGRTTTGTGNPEDLTASQAAAIIQGSITSLTAPALTGVTTIAGVGSVQALDPGSITTSQTWTVTITMSTANRKYCVFDIFLAAGSGTAFEYALYRANVGMLKNPVGSVVGAFIHEQVNAANNATITALATTTSGVVMSVSGLSSTFNSNSLMVIGIINAASITVSSVVA